MTTPIVQTARLYARHFRPDDLDAFAGLCADPEVMRYVGDGTVLDRDGVARWIEVCQRKYADRGYGTSGVFERSTGDFVGYCGVVRAPGREFDELVYVYHRHFWGRGYATEMGAGMLDHVFAISPLGEIAATIHPDNTASVAVVRKLGMREYPPPFAEGDDATRYFAVTREEHAERAGRTPTRERSTPDARRIRLVR